MTQRKTMRKRPRKLTDLQRVRLIREVYDALFRETESFREDDVGVQLAYLFGAIADRSGRETIELRSQDDGRVLALLERLFAEGHAVWDFIDIIPSD